MLSQNKLKSIDLNNNLDLREILLDYNQLTRIDLSEHPKYTSIDISNNNLRQIICFCLIHRIKSSNFSGQNSQKCEIKLLYDGLGRQDWQRFVDQSKLQYGSASDKFNCKYLYSLIDAKQYQESKQASEIVLTVDIN